LGICASAINRTGLYFRLSNESRLLTCLLPTLSASSTCFSTTLSHGASRIFELERHSWQALFLLLDLPAAGANPNPSTSPVFHLYTAQVAPYLLHLALALLDVTVFRTLVVFVSAPWIVSARPFNNLTSLPRTIPSAHTTRLFTCRSPAMPGLEMAPLVADDMRGMLPRLR
jgi:hypothetical protein